ncbi:MAG: phage integrase SAM-like domain-containing protein [Bacteroidota bacterium]
MATTVTIVLDTRSKSKKGHPLAIRIYNKTERKISLKIYALSEQWNGYEVTSDHPNSKEINRFLTQRRAKLLKEVEYCNQHNLDLKASAEIIKNGLQDKALRIAALEQELRKLKGERETMLFDFWKDYIKERESRGLDSRAMSETMVQFQNYTMGEDIPINTITYEFLYDFSTFKLSGKCNRPGLNHYLRTLKTVYKEAQRRDSLQIKSDNPFRGLITNDKKSDIVQMSPEELLAWINYTPHKFTHEGAAKSQLRRKDIFVFQLLIGGHDFADIAVLEWKNIRGNRIRFKRYKNRRHTSGGPIVDNLLVSMATDIIAKYGTTNRDRVFGFIPHPKDKSSYLNFQKNTRRTYRRICSQLGLQDLMKSKSPRYIFKTWADELELDLRAINQVMGHSQRTGQGVSAGYGARLHNDKADFVIRRVTERVLLKK